MRTNGDIDQAWPNDGTRHLIRPPLLPHVTLPRTSARRSRVIITVRTGGSQAERA